MRRRRRCQAVDPPRAALIASSIAGWTSSRDPSSRAASAASRPRAASDGSSWPISPASAPSDRGAPIAARSASEAPTSVKASRCWPRRPARTRDVLEHRHQRPEVVEVAIASRRPPHRPGRHHRAGQGHEGHRRGCSGRRPTFSRSPTSAASRMASSHRRRADSWSPARPSIQARFTRQFADAGGGHRASCTARGRDRVARAPASIALLLDDDPEVAGERRDARLVAEPLPDLQALEVSLARERRVATLGRHRAGDLEHVRLAGRIADGREPLRRRARAALAASSNRPTRRADSASEWSHRAMSPRSPDASASARASRHDRLGPRHLADHVQDLREGDRALDARRPIEQRDQPLEVVDRRSVGVGGLGPLRPRRPGIALLALVVVAQPEVVREQVELLLERRRLGSSSMYRPIAAVEHRRGRRTAGSRRRPPGSTTCLNSYARSCSRSSVTRSTRAQRVELPDDLVEVAELRVGAAAASAPGTRGR